MPTSIWFIFAILGLVEVLSGNTLATTTTGKPAAATKKLPKDLGFMSEIDAENLYDQWEDTDEDVLPVDEMEPHKRPLPDPSNLARKPGEVFDESAYSDPEKYYRLLKKGKTVMAFVSLADKTPRVMTEDLSARWHTGLQNAHIISDRFIIADDRALFVFKNGDQAFEAKDFFLQQPECKDVMIDNQTWQGPAYPIEKVDKDSKSNVKRSSGDKVATDGESAPKPTVKDAPKSNSRPKDEL